MHYLSAENLSKSFGITPLFSNISFHISEGDKIALIARNGFGKSTLLKILCGQETPDNGKLWVNKDVNVVFFEQDPLFEEQKTIAENIFNHNHPVLNAVRNYEIVCEGTDDDKIAKAIFEMDELNAWDFDAQVKLILSKLNIHHLDQYMISISGGQRKRVALAKTLIDIGFENRHTFLIMDEPTNHLDVAMVEWLEYYLNQQHVTLLMVTHDRYFLDSVCTEIWEIDRGEIYTYKGDYANYLEKKAARLENDLSSIDKAKNEFRKELEWMRKQPKARTTKSKSRIDAFEDVERRAKQKIVDEQMQLNIKMNRLGGKVAEFKKVYKSFGDLKIMNGFDYTFTKGERIGIVGKNGVGKSTFINILQGLEQPDSGKINIGDTVIFGYYSQSGLQWKEDLRVIEYVKQFAETFPLAKGGAITASQFLELFLFSPEKQYTYLSMLSGGEKRRLQLLTILFRNPNFLVLDEPTNDLDLPTLGVLENFLREYSGCVLVISHDRFFMDNVVDHLFIFEGEGEIRDFPGSYSQYRQQVIREEEQKLEDKIIRKEAEKQAVKTANEGKKKFSFKEKREFELLQKELADFEKEKLVLTEKMNDASLPFNEMQLIINRFAEINNLLEEKELRWLELSEMEG